MSDTESDHDFLASLAAVIGEPSLPAQVEKNLQGTFQ